MFQALKLLHGFEGSVAHKLICNSEASGYSERSMRENVHWFSLFKLEYIFAYALTKTTSH